MVTKNVVPRATGEGSLGTPTKKWGDVQADKISGSVVTATPTANAILKADASGKIDDAWLSAPPGTGGGSLVLTLAHSTTSKSTTSATYEALYTGSFIGRSDWYEDPYEVMVGRSGSGQIKVRLSDGTSMIESENAAFSSAGIDTFSMASTALANNKVWTFTVFVKSSATAYLDRVKLFVNPVNEFAPITYVTKKGNVTNSAEFVPLGTSYFIAAGTNVDAASRVLALCQVDKGTAASVEIRVTVSGTGSSESVTQSTSTSGIMELRCPYPPVAAAVIECQIDGRVSSGAGTLSLDHYQLNVER